MRPPGWCLVLLYMLAAQARRHERRDQGESRAMVETRMKTERALQACRLHCEERIIFQELLDGCSIFTFGSFMGEQPRNATLNIRTNGTLLVELVGSALYFNTTDLFYDFLQRFINSTCPEGGKPKVSLNEICRLESDQPLCTVYKLSGSPPNNFFQPGNHTLSFKDFDPRFKWSFWSVQHIAPHPIWPAHVEVESVFYNIPEGPPKLVLYNAAFFAMWTVVVVFFVSNLCITCGLKCFLFVCLLTDYRPVSRLSIVSLLACRRCCLMATWEIKWWTQVYG